MIFSLFTAYAVLRTASALSFPTTPSGLTILQSQMRPGVSISYKETHICETTPGVKAYSGYIHFPSTSIPDLEGDTPFNASLYFWFFESRNDPKNSPLSIYLGGGPGTSSLTGTTYESGPCTINADSNSTTLNPWSWNNHVNMLYIDQPVQVGYSYDSLVNVTMNLLTTEVAPITSEDQLTSNDPLTLVGTLPSQNASFTANNTQLGSKMLWHFAQVWFTEFPEYNTSDKRISVWANSYGGFYGPGAVAYFQKQNEKINNGTINGQKAVHLEMDTVGITNGCIDSLYFMASYPDMAYNNTYGYQGFSEAVYQDAMNNVTKPGGCRDMTLKCRELAAIGDPNETGSNATVNEACALATDWCFTNVQGAFLELSGRNGFDIAHENIVSYPPEYNMGYFNQRWVQEELGVPVNFTLTSMAVYQAFWLTTGDSSRRDLSSLNYIAESGIKVALVFGDRDYRCNWIGAERTSLAMNYTESAQFQAAGYEGITVNSTYEGGVVRQHNGVSFARVYEAGHGVSAYQPETVYQIFNRVMFNKDVATGNTSAYSLSAKNQTSYSSTGPESSFDIKNKMVDSPPNTCYIWDAPHTCTDEQLTALQNGTALVKDYIVVSIGSQSSTKPNHASLNAPWSGLALTSAVLIAALTFVL